MSTERLTASGRAATSLPAGLPLRRTLVMRADAGRAIGAGHVTRCLALAERCLKAGDRVVLAAAELPEPMRQHLVAAGVEPVEIPGPPGSQEDARRTAEIARAAHAAWVIADGYRFDATYQRCVRSAGLRLLLLDDFGQVGEYDADLVVDQNLGASADAYGRRRPETRLLLGPRFVLLRRQFTDRAWGARQATPPPCRVLVTLGGGDSGSGIRTVVRGVTDLPEGLLAEAVVVLGPAAAVPDLRETSRVRICRNVTEMAALMADADLAIAAGGTTAWELAYMGIPSLFMAMADNQVPNCRQLEAVGAGKYLGWHAEVSSARIREAVTECLLAEGERTRMAQCGRALIDGRGTMRVWLHLNEERLRLREAGPQDARQLWEWTNIPEVRAASFSPEPIPWERHLAWFAARQASPSCYLWLAEEEGRPIGVVRFEAGGKEAIISVSLDAAARGRQLGTLLIWSACRRFFAARPAMTIRALIRPENGASVRAFTAAGFVSAGECVERGCRALAFQADSRQVAA